MSGVENSLYEIDRGDGEKIVFTKSEFNKKMYYHIRTYVRSVYHGQPEQWLPTKKGVSFTKNELPSFFKGVEEMKNAI